VHGHGATHFDKRPGEVVLSKDPPAGVGPGVSGAASTCALPYTFSSTSG
jgi:hypothetical protein